jgi:biotin carboxylase
VAAEVGHLDGVPLVLVVGSGVRPYREYLLAAACRVAPLWLLDSVEATWQSAYLAGSTVVDVSDPAALVGAGAAVTMEHAVGGVLCYDEALILATAYLREALGLPGMGVAAVEACRDKRSTRAILRRSGLPQPVSITVATLDEARAAAAETGYPLVVKPRALGASNGVRLVDDASGLATAFEVAREASHPLVPTYEEGVLVEEFLEGPEISVDGYWLGGRYRAMFVAHKRVGFEPGFEEVGHVVSADDPLLADPEVLAVLEQTHAALGAEAGVTHTELRLTPKGPQVVEVNGRLGGDLIPYVGWLASGIDPGRVATQLALGRHPRARPSRHRAGAVRFLYPPQDCVVEAVDTSRVSWPEGVDEGEVRIPVQPGDTLRLPPAFNLGRYAAVICCAATPERCELAAAQVAAQVELRWRPVGRDVGG